MRGRVDDWRAFLAAGLADSDRDAIRAAELPAGTVDTLLRPENKPALQSVLTFTSSRAGSAPPS